MKKAFSLENVKVFGNLDGMVGKVAISPGSGKSMIGIALAAGLILWFGVMKDHKLKKTVGIVMLAAYALYFVYLLSS